MRFESSVTAISWIPSEAVEGLPKIPFSMGVAHYDEPPPDVIDDLEAMTEADAFREANELHAFIEMEDGKIVDYGHLGGGHLGVTKVKLGPREVSVPAIAMPTLQPEPEVGDGWVRFTQTAGGRTGMPAPRHVHGKPLLPDLLRAGLDDPVAQALRRRLVRARAQRRQHVSSPLGLQGGQARREERSHRLQRVVPQGVRREHALGQGGLGALRDRRRDGPRAGAFENDHAERLVLEAAHP